MTAGDDTEVLLAHLMKNPVLGHARPESLRQIAPHCRLVAYRAGRTFLKEGEAADQVYCLVTGGVRVFHKAPGEDEIVVKLFGAPVFFGEADVLLGISWLESVQTVMPSEIIHIPGPVFQKLLRADHGLCYALVYDLSTRLLIATEHARTLAFGSAEARIAAFLLDHQALFGRPVPGGTLIDLRLSQDSVGKSLAISRKTVQRALQKWLDEGVLERDSGRFVIKKTESLRGLLSASTFGLAYKLENLATPGEDLSELFVQGARLGRTSNDAPAPSDDRTA